MSTNPYSQNTKNLRSPLLNPPSQNDKPVSQNNSKSKKLYFNINEESSINNVKSINNIASKITQPIEIVDKVNYKAINFLEVSFKVLAILIGSIGGLLALLELINVIQLIRIGSHEISNSLIVFTIAFIGTSVSLILSLSFIHLIKITKHLYSSFKFQNKKIEKLIELLSVGNCPS